MASASLPTLVIVSGPPGAGKTTLAHQLALGVGCPAICRDEIKEGMVHATPGFVPGPADPLTMRTLPVFFCVLKLLLEAGVTTVAEAAFQDRLWQPGLAPLLGLAHIRIVHCVVDADVALRRKLLRGENEPKRRAHADRAAPDITQHALGHNAFQRICLEDPSIEVDTTDGYAPAIDEIVAFVNGQGGKAPGQGRRR